METPTKFNLFEYYKLFSQQDIQISYKGPIDERILSVIGNYIEVILGKNPKASKKIFSIFIELAQNVSFYSAEFNELTDGKEIGVGTLVVGEFGNYYTFVTGNVVRNEDIIPVIEKCEIINSLDRDQLREYKRNQRRLPPGVKGGGNIGLIQVALTSCNPLDFEVTPINENYSFFSIAAKVDKE